MSFSADSNVDETVQSTEPTGTGESNNNDGFKPTERMTQCANTSPGCSPEDCLKASNEARATKGCPGLTWDAGLAQDAQNQANLNAAAKKMQHLVAPGVNEGENLYMSTSSNANFSDAVRAWMAEAQFYDGSPLSQDNYHKVGHYTQLMWRNSTQVGMAKALANDGSTYIAARYRPQGNIAGQTPF
ncbi:PR-1-like protein [Piedraia hortae CBS 480.64]|uniref:PR-1-like protein n=1 Tax=Piedraia hortae CBS 480.64 TaxID=1314780 RepID=A0A6A7BYR8_9PEZI|nr:PR-1-like protein [Piedraia hortae CBS 480.64]